MRNDFQSPQARLSFASLQIRKEAPVHAQMHCNIGLGPSALQAELASPLAKPNADVVLSTGHPTMMAVGFRLRVGHAPTPHTMRRTTTALKLSLLVALAAGAALPQVSTPPTTSKVKIEATELDRRLLLQKLNAHGADHRMKFELADSAFDYRIVFSTHQEKMQATIWASGGSINTSMATADVFDANGTELFRFDRKQRGTDSGAANAVAKEIIKRILKLKSLPANAS